MKYLITSSLKTSYILSKTSVLSTFGEKTLVTHKPVVGVELAALQQDGFDAFSFYRRHGLTHI